MRTPSVITIDFETEAIEDRPRYPPVPVGVSILRPGDRKARYYAWGHPVENNCTREEARKALLACFEQKEYDLLFHNAKFDVDVGEVHLGLPRLGWERYHDTMFLLFLYDPHAKSLSLKPSADRILGMPPEEQEAVRDWLVAHGHATKTEKGWGAHIARAPGKLVGEYANGDVVRTKKLFTKLYPDIHKRGMLAAYDRERRLMPILLDSEREGVRVDRAGLEADIEMYDRAMEDADDWLRKRLKTPGLNVDSNDEFADALEKNGVVTDFVYTKTGKRSVSKKNLTLDMFKDAGVAAVYGYRNALSTCLNTFMRSWAETAAAGAGSRIYTTWNQVRQSNDGGNLAGARTGRMSSTPPLLNIPKEFPEAIARPQVKGLRNPLPHLPFVRKYVLPDDPRRDYWLRRDYSQQEYRILAHYEDGSLKKAYQENPRLDIHDWLQGMILAVLGLDLPRKGIKILNFAEVYGMGKGHQAEALHTDIATINRILAAKAGLMDGLPRLKKEINQRAKANLPIRTWGGREYYVEEPKYSEKHGRWFTFEYKLLNYLIQGSAADCTKEAIIRYHDVRRDGRFRVAVHDELDLSVPRKALRSESKLLEDAMASIEFDVKMLSEGEYGPNWWDLKEI